MRKYSKIVLIFAIGFFCGIAVICIPWEGYDPNYGGTVADWVTGLITMGAFIWSISVIFKQTEIQRALNIENQRPRFSYERTLIIRKGNVVLRSDNSSDSTPEKIKNKLKKEEGYLFRINNISKNPIYSLRIILSHDNRIDTYIFHGLAEKSSVVLIFTPYMKKWNSLYIKFRTTANEIGYMYSSPSKKTKYYFVKGQNKVITASGEDKMIFKNAKIVQEFNEIFESQKPGTGYFYAEKNIGK